MLQNNNKKTTVGFQPVENSVVAWKNENLNFLVSDLLNLDNPMTFYN